MLLSLFSQQNHVGIPPTQAPLTPWTGPQQKHPSAPGEQPLQGWKCTLTRPGQCPPLTQCWEPPAKCGGRGPSPTRRQRWAMPTSSAHPDLQPPASAPTCKQPALRGACDAKVRAATGWGTAALPPSPHVLACNNGLPASMGSRAARPTTSHAHCCTVPPRAP